MITKLKSVALGLSLTLASGSVLAATEWSVSLWSKRRAFTEHVEKLAELVSEKTNGEFKLNISYGGLSKNKENLDGIAIGAFEMAQFCSFYHKDKNPSITVTELPFSKNLSLQDISDISLKIYQHPIVKKDLARWDATLLMPSPLPQYNIIGVGDTPESLAEFKGRRLRGPGGITNVMSKLGAVKTGVAANEVRQALDAGVIDTVAFAPHAHMAFGSIQVGKWATTNLNLGTGECPVVVNTLALESLKPEFHKALMDSVPEALEYYINNYENNVVGKYEALLEEKGITKVNFSKEQTLELQALSEDVRQQWIKDNSKRFKAKELFEYMQSLVSEKHMESRVAEYKQISAF
ncbi:TRAP transporter substrate-binding protein DctP [Sessilibacter corallicola]|uniref:C4-dicarboxylate ABC transporter substrate-binding protein n=1 Tax=Sessilibacter corallicola TaxID=2904075 RepID=A0ABQ0A762_9GAMM|nr:TRAP transporter substrate-binding protein DctP [Sessilibacter corallicola]MCE2028416.1 TRAP transporter substrate-binding protein DctP [Sessilibacter corallicola]